jgi:hypothetical protein
MISDDMIKLPISAADRKEATDAANGRQDFAEQQNWRSRGAGEIPRARERLNSLVGCLGELKCSQYFGMKFDPSIGIITNVDCEIFEVRTRRIDSGRDLAITPDDKMRLPYVLVWIDRLGTTATIVGWLCGWEGHQRAMQAKEAAGGRDVWFRPVRVVWFIPPPYHSVKSLRQWIQCGHLLHWCPEKYR